VCHDHLNSNQILQHAEMTSTLNANALEANITSFPIIKAHVDYGKQEHPNYLVILTQVPNLFKYPNSDTKQSRHSPGAKKQQLISYTILYKLLLREYFV